MSIINTTFGFVFVHVPKSAGTSVTSVLSRLSTPLDIEVGGSQFGEAVQSAFQKRHGISKHSTARELRASLGEQTWMRFTSFGVVRHPLSRLASAYRFIRQWDAPGNKYREAMSAFETFEDFLASDIWIDEDGVDRMFRPQAFWLADANRNELLVDHVCKVETLDDDLRRILGSLGVKPSLLPEAVPRLNTTDGATEQFDLAPELLERVRQRYARDLSMFDYSIDV